MFERHLSPEESHLVTRKPCLEHLRRHKRYIKTEHSIPETHRGSTRNQGGQSLPLWTVSMGLDPFPRP